MVSLLQTHYATSLCLGFHMGKMEIMLATSQSSYEGPKANVKEKCLAHLIQRRHLMSISFLFLLDTL